MAISPEMQEALDILREDHAIKAFNGLTQSNKDMIARMDQWEEKYGKSGNTDDTGRNGGSGDPNGDNPPPNLDSDSSGDPKPPPVRQPPTNDPPKKKRKFSYWPESGE